ncbi:MAG TPA: serine hydrolase [Woeseiaceae bacterium]|nr:serine hydrolase [Woeseiaceae bacterium]
MLKIGNTLLRAAIAIFALGTCSTALMAAPSTKDIDRLLERAVKEFNAPGIAVSVVYDDKLFYADGRGITEVGTRTRIDENTLFQIASVSKAFTTASLALLVDEGKVGWDEPVIDYLPDFRMHDPWVTREFTIRDLLTHRSGLPLGAGDLLLFPKGNTTREEIIHAMRYLKPSTSFRSAYAYDNLLYIIAGEVVAAVSGIPFERFVEERLFAPLGMTDCSATFERVKPGAVKATPHVLVDGKLTTTTSLESSTAAAAGGINCSARSMAKWAQFILDDGRTADGKQLISEAQVAELLKPVTITSSRGYMAEYAGQFLSGYALGWGVSTFYGEPMYSHSGGLWGMTTYIAVLPKERLAVFASNNQLSGAPLAIVNDVLDLFLKDDNDEPRDWIAILSEVSSDRKDDAAKAVKEAADARDADSKPSLPLASYVGTYTDPWYGEIEIGMGDDGQLWFQSGRSEKLSGPLEHFQYDTFIARWSDRRLHADAYVSFSLSPLGKVEKIRMKAVSPATDFSFDFHDLDLTRVADPQ